MNSVRFLSVSQSVPQREDPGAKAHVWEPDDAALGCRMGAAGKTGGGAAAGEGGGKQWGRGRKQTNRGL